jgi:hypothetical protein
MSEVFSLFFEATYRTRRSAVALVALLSMRQQARESEWI